MGLMILWRISNYADLLGIGGMQASGRWHTAGRPIVYLAETPASALLETLVHLEVDEYHRPTTYQLLKIEVPGEVSREETSLQALPVGWRRDEGVPREIGDAWLLRSSSALMRVPSVITPETGNWLLNPRHPDAAALRILHAERHLYDSRLL
jgi:RES domain-containing protein